MKYEITFERRELVTTTIELPSEMTLEVFKGSLCDLAEDPATSLDWEQEYAGVAKFTPLEDQSEQAEYYWNDYEWCFNECCSRGIDPQ